MDKFHETLRDFSKHYTDYIPEIPVLQHIPTPIEFVSNYVMPNKPFVISCPENHLPAVSRWKEYFYLEKTMYDEFPLTCIIPSHRPYPIVYDCYMEPEIQKMPCYHILYALKYEKRKAEYYYVKQPNNLHEFRSIADDIRSDVPWATEAFGNGPIAANLSFGNAVNFTTLHKDEYDNFFYVLKGSRRFKLIPPIAHFCIPHKTYKKFQWLKSRTEKDKFEKIDLNEEIDFIPRVWENREMTQKTLFYWTLGDEEPETLEKLGFFRNIKQYEVTVHPGDALYIPTLWYHEYVQSDDCFTLNYWYDIKWDWKYPLLTFLGKLFKLKKPSMYKEAFIGTQTELEESLYKDLSREVTQKHLIS